MKKSILVTFMVAAQAVLCGHVFAAPPAGSTLMEPQNPGPMIIEQQAIEAARVEVLFNSVGEVVQVNACESDYLCTQARLLPARGIQFYVGDQPISLDAVHRLHKRAATIIYDADSGMVEKVRYFEVIGGESDE